MAKKKSVKRKVAAPKRNAIATKRKPQKKPVARKIAQAETFELPVASPFQKQTEVPQLAGSPLDVPQMAPDTERAAKTVGVPHAATAVLAAGIIGVITFCFFLFYMNLGLLYSAAIALPIFVAFGIAINSMLEEKAR